MRQSRQCSSNTCQGCRGISYIEWMWLKNAKCSQQSNVELVRAALALKAQGGLHSRPGFYLSVTSSELLWGHSLPSLLINTSTSAYLSAAAYKPTTCLCHTDPISWSPSVPSLQSEPAQARLHHCWYNRRTFNLFDICVTFNLLDI